jgi:mono/diheme cytochrome c family protein
MRLAIVSASLALLTLPALAQGNPQAGHRLVEANCARCHAIDRTGDSPLPIAPPFRTLHTRYPVENLAEALAEGIMVGHPTMPEFRLDPDQIENLIAYLKTLER